MPLSFSRQPVPDYSIWQATNEALKYLNDQWGAEPGPWGVTGHLRAWDHTPFTVGVTETGALFLRNDQLGDATTLKVTATDSLDTVARAIADAVDGLY
ncbi:hypothetical protein [Streptomyces sp. NRRL S-1896]|uniref:hypothetical protein n=1 Tax=Streptomyces sp. NRRL S-1896 TaxID=1463893 RepID=UPI0004CC6284|nr:hypothetical protein [Streptomyces sp. NRRL S-1896]